MNEELRQFIKESLEKGLEREAIRNVLLEAGWQERDLRGAFAAFAEVDFPVAVPRPRPYLHAREAFLYLVSFIALYVSAFSFGAMLFGLIDHTFSDSPYRYVSYRSGVQASAIASVIVAFPVYLVLMRWLARSVAMDPERRQSLIRRWLTYLTLVVGASVILGDVIALLSSLLAGDPTITFFFKVAAILVITVPIFGYYLWDMRQAEDEVSISVVQAAPVLRALVIGAIVVVIAGVGYSTYVIGTPGQQRDIRLDQERTDNLRNISRNIDIFLELNGEIPASLGKLTGPKYHVQSIGDPDSGAPYEYRIVEDADYELCAVFATASSERNEGYRSFSESVWDHGVGRTCFQLTAKADP